MSAKIISSQGITAQWGRLDAAQCQAFLKTVPEYQRAVKKSNLTKIKSALTSGEFRQNGEPIILNEANQLIDGQHRVRAFLETGVFPEILIVRGVDGLDSYITIDGGSARGLTDTFKAAGIKNYTHAASASKKLLELEKRKIGASVFHNQMILNHYWLREDMIQFWVTKFSRLNTIISPSVRTAVLCYIETSHSNVQAEEFGQTIESGIGPSAYRVLRTLLIRNANKPRGKMTEREILFVCCRAAKSRIEENRTVKQIKIDGSFPYLTGKEVSK